MAVQDCDSCFPLLCACPVKADCESPEPRRCLEDVEADARVLMTKHAAIADRGFDSKRERHELHRRIDALLDEYAMRADIDAVIA